MLNATNISCSESRKPLEEDIVNREIEDSGEVYHVPARAVSDVGVEEAISRELLLRLGDVHDMLHILVEDSVLVFLANLERVLAFLVIHVISPLHSWLLAGGDVVGPPDLRPHERVLNCLMVRQRECVLCCVLRATQVDMLGGDSGGRAQIRLHVVIYFVTACTVKLRNVEQDVRREVAQGATYPSVEHVSIFFREKTSTLSRFKT
jgi:hypothetical protein